MFLYYFFFHLFHLLLPMEGLNKNVLFIHPTYNLDIIRYSLISHGWNSLCTYVASSIVFLHKLLITSGLETSHFVS